MYWGAGYFATAQYARPVALFRYRSIRALATPISLSLNTAPHVRYFARWAQYAHVGLFLPPLEKKLLQKKKLLDTPIDYAYKPPSPTG